MPAAECLRPYFACAERPRDVWAGSSRPSRLTQVLNWNPSCLRVLRAFVGSEFESRTAMCHEWNAASYHRVSGPQTEWGRKVLSRLTVAGAECVIDAGCGTGKLTRELMQLLPRG